MINQYYWYGECRCHVCNCF